MSKLGRIIRFACIGIAALVMGRFECSTAVAQAAANQQGISSQGLQFSIASARSLGKSVSVQLLIRNTSQLRQYIMYCIIPSSGASLGSGQKLAIATQKITGIPYMSAGDIRSCFSNILLENMTYIEPDSSLAILLNWYDAYNPNNEISPSNTISFPLNLAVRTETPLGVMDTSASRKEPGPIHAVNVGFPLIALSAGP
jgi:hypothetical protein